MWPLWWRSGINWLVFSCNTFPSSKVIVFLFSYTTFELLYACISLKMVLITIFEGLNVFKICSYSSTMIFETFLALFTYESDYTMKRYFAILASMKVCTDLVHVIFVILHFYFRSETKVSVPSWSVMHRNKNGWMRLILTTDLILKIQSWLFQICVKTPAIHISSN